MDLLARLRELIGDAALLTRSEDKAPYLVDHRRLFQGAALAIVQPASTDEVSRLLAWCNGVGLGVVPQGGNTGYCGGATPDASGRQIVLSLRRLNRIRNVDAANFSLVAEAGCTLAAVQAAAANALRLFPLSLGSEGSCQIGGNLATNAGGTAVLRYGMMRDLTLGLEVVLADGNVISALSPLRKDNTGYDLKDLMIGSEGTLGIITAACLKLFPQPQSVATAWISVPHPQAAIALLGRLRDASSDRVASCELIPQSALDLVIAHVPGTRSPGTTPSAWYLLVELTSSRIEDLDALLEQVLAAAIEAGEALDAAVARSGQQRQQFWHLRESVPEAQSRAGGSLKHDVSVVVSAVPQLIERGAELAAQLVPEGFLVAYGHAGDGNLHFNVNQRPGADATLFRSRQPVLQRAIHELVADMGGSFSAEHGIGQLKVAELERYAQPAELAAMRSIKQALDPNGILNPGKVLRSSAV
ncbi:MAG: FAD-binding oxidoreductase [Pseudomonadota bacterium]